MELKTATGITAKIAEFTVAMDLGSVNMNKWIEQMSLDFLANGTRHPYGDDMKQSFEAGATATLNRVREIIEQSRKDNELEMYHVDPLKDPLINEGRESLRAELLKDLEEL